jgi:cellulose synthase/poly-beta-1,6-N-acetylglucosamine synthase-like glycosyltransferase
MVPFFRSLQKGEQSIQRKPKRNYTVDMLTTACPGEPFAMIEATLKAMVAVKYPHENYLCDEGNDPKLKELCRALEVNHVTRETHENAKAGNINNALKNATGEVCVILDPDHVPFPEFLDHVLAPFDDPEVGYVQIVQAYKNQSESLVAHAAAEQTYLFYGPYMEAMGKYGTAQAIGANCTFRRKALDSIGGHAPGLTEDMHTSMLLHAKGWKSVYLPKILSLGLVPSSLAAYYQQQLKWSRGTFDLLFNKVPKLFSNFTLRQKLHYFLIPVYFLFGLLGIIDIAVPVYSLFTGEYPWILNPVVFFAFFTPYLIATLFQRFYAQKWLHDPNERGLHLLGGILRLGTWWVYSIGFIYTLLNIKVPYIPTPKEHSSKGDFMLGLPNLFISILSIGSAIYGLSSDWQPYSFMMAGFALVNGIVFFLAFSMGQSVWVSGFRRAWFNFKNMFLLRRADLTYVKLSRIGIPVVIFFPLIFSVFFILVASNFKIEHYFNKKIETALDKDRGGFYLGIYLPSFLSEANQPLLTASMEEADTDWSVISTYLFWSDQPLPKKQWQSIIDNGAIPMITWEPWANLFEKYQGIDELGNNKKIFKYITEGYFDDYITHFGETIRDLDSPVFLRFAHEIDNPMYQWSKTGENTPEEFKAAWKYIHYKFELLGVQNISWVFSPWDPEAIADYFPYGQDSSITEYVDWIGLTTLNYDKASADCNYLDFEEIYLPYRQKIKELSLDLPVMLAEFGSTGYSREPAIWVNESLEVIESQYPEINSVILFYSNQDKNWITDFRPENGNEFIDWTYGLSDISSYLDLFDQVKLPDKVAEESIPKPAKSENIVDNEGSFSMFVDGESFYMKGICYNTGHDWEEGFIPLTRNQIADDFTKIKALGANTIRRYEPSIYDWNIFMEAKDKGLKIMYGFWFDPKTDYLKHQNILKAYEKKVLKNVRRNVDEESIIAWSIGNETWGLLKKYYGQPYLTVVRREYVKFLENLAQKIHKIDPNRPVFSSEEHDNVRLLGTIHDFKKYAPSIDVLGINSYYDENISTLNEVFTKTDPDRPYAITEFGPKGYWNKELGDFWQDSLLLEQSAVTKARSYKHQWENYIAPHQGSNLGGFAFSWQDRFEGTATWFGIVDFKGSLKPAYHYLESAWKGTAIADNSFPDLKIVGQWQSVKPGEKIWMTAATLNDYKGKLDYLWRTYEEGTWEKSNPVTNVRENGKYAEIQMPGNKSRIYLFAYDSVGNVISASRPLILDRQKD